jgi:hypothetical protein
MHSYEHQRNSLPNHTKGALMLNSDLAKRFKLTAILSGIALLTACGGGGGDSDTATAPTEPAPTTPAPTEPTPTEPTPTEPTPTEPAPTTPAPTEPTPTEPTPTEPTPTEPTPPATTGPEPIAFTPGTVVALNCDTCATTAKDVVVDGAGNATVAWAENNNGARTIKAARYNAATQTWERQTIATVNNTVATLQVGADDLGNVKAGWLTGGSFFLSQYDVATNTWSPARRFFGGNILSAGPETFSVAPNGTVYFTYFFVPGTLTAEGFPVQSVGAFIYDPSKPDAEAVFRTRIDSNNEQAISASLDVDPNGNAFIAWSTRLTGEPGAFRGRVYTSRYRPANGFWGAVRERAASGAYAPDISLRPNGRAVLVYGVTNNGTNDIVFRQYDPTTSLFTATRSIGAQSASPAVGLDVEADAQGNAFIAWSQAGTGQLLTRYDATANSFNVNPELYPVATDVGVPDVAVDVSSGNAVHAFSNNAEPSQSATNIVRYAAQSGTYSTAPQPLNTAGQGGTAPEVAIGSNSVAVATWRQPSGTIENLKARVVAP